MRAKWRKVIWAILALQLLLWHLLFLENNTHLDYFVNRVVGHFGLSYHLYFHWKKLAILIWFISAVIVMALHYWNLDTMLYGFDENGDFVDSYLITYNAARSKKIDIYLGGSSGAVFDIEKDFKPLVEAVSVMPLKETVAEWSGRESFGILY